MHQPKKISLIEAITSNVAGLIVTFLMQQFAYPLLGFPPVSTATTVVGTLALTAVMTVKSYGIRRLFTAIGKHIARKHKSAKKKRRAARKKKGDPGA